MKNLAFVSSILICLLICSCTKKSSPSNVIKTTEENDSISDGYSSTSPNKKTGASSSVEYTKTLLNLDDHLRGLAGVNVVGSGSGATIRVRGVNSFQSGSNEPLFVINGTPMGSYASAYSALDPINIKRVTVLSDAASTGIYGVRGANGVIIITLKNTK
jgi:TonB-dependent SusC/RagA subfamily outer membrane receptor